MYTVNYYLQKTGTYLQSTGKMQVSTPTGVHHSFAWKKISVLYTS